MNIGFDIALYITLGGATVSQGRTITTQGVEYVKSVELSSKPFVSQTDVLAVTGAEVGWEIEGSNPILMNNTLISVQGVALHVFARPYKTGDTGQVIDIGFYPNFYAVPRFQHDGETIQFTDDSYGIEPVRWKWSFGDGLTSPLENPPHIYAEDGLYTVKLEVWSVDNEYGVAEKEEYITVLYSPVADFSAGPLIFCNPETVEFKDRSLHYPTAWLWDFGDGGSSTEQSPTHIYREMGKYTVTLTVTKGSLSDVVSSVNLIESKCVMLSCYISQIRGSVGEEDENADYPFDLYRDWAHKDIVDTAKNLISVSKGFYRQASSLPVQNSEGMVFTEISHDADSLVVTGFSGLTPDDYIGGAIFAVYGNRPYIAKIVSNTADEITLEDELDLPALVNADVVISRSVSGLEVDLSSLKMFWIENPFWFIEDGGGEGIGMAPLEFDSAVDQIQQYDGKVFYRIEGRKLQLMLGSAAKLTGLVNLGYWREPNKAMSPMDCIDLPLEFHSLAQMLTIARIRAKAGDESEAASLRARYHREIHAIQNSIRRVEKQEKFLGVKLN